MNDSASPRPMPSDDEVYLGEASKPPVGWSLEKIEEEFDRTRDLNTIQIHETILFRQSDVDEGSGRFIRLFDSLIGKRGPFIPTFEAKWMVSDPAQLQHVLRETKTQSRGIFNVLNAHATVFIADKSSDYHRMIMNFSEKFCNDQYKAMTGFPSDVGGGYRCYGHFAPPADQSDQGFLCATLDNISSDLNQLLAKLHRAHVERIQNGNVSAFEHFEHEAIYIVSLDDLIA